MFLWSLWVFAAALAMLFFFELVTVAESIWRSVKHSPQERETRLASQALLGLQECLEAGLVPNGNEWAQLETLGDLWGTCAAGAIQDLRARGAAVLPTLQRLRALAEEMLEFNHDARAKSGGAFGQAVTLFFMVPALALALWGLVPEIQSVGGTWWLAVAVCSGLAAAGALWIIRLAEMAKWMGLRSEDRGMILASQVIAERLLALIRSGHAPDVAWTETLVGADAFAERLSELWGRGFWRTESVAALPALKKGPAGLIMIAELGTSLRRTIQVSVMEGHSATERIESVLAGFRRDFRGAVGRELSLLPNKALKPLFVCVMPSVAVLLVAGFGLAVVGL